MTRPDDAQHVHEPEVLPLSVTSVKSRPPGGYREKKKPVVSPRKKRLEHARALTEEKIQEMFGTYCQMPNLAYVGRVCNVHATTVRKYAKEFEWERRRQDILQKAREKMDYTVEKATEDSIVMARALKQKLAQKISTLQAQDISTNGLVSDFERLVKLEQILLGGVSERQEAVLTTHEERIKRLRAERNYQALPEKTVSG